MGNKRNPWTEEQLQFIRDNYDRMTDSDMSLYLQPHTEFSVACKRKRMGLHRSAARHNYQEALTIMQQRNYIILSTEEDYKDCLSPLKYICPKHKDYGVQVTNLGHMLEGKGCMVCGWERTGESELVPEEKLEAKCEEKGLIYKGRYMDKDKYSGIEFICTKHPLAGVQKMRYSNLCRDFIIGCKYCGKQFKDQFYSVDVQRIELYLKEHEIEYIKEYEFEECRDQKVLPFDFYLPLNNCCIEYDGEQHWHPATFCGISKEEAKKNLIRTQKHDKMRDKYCEENEIPLLRIAYTDTRKLENILEAWLKEQGILKAV